MTRKEMKLINEATLKIDFKPNKNPNIEAEGHIRGIILKLAFAIRELIKGEVFDLEDLDTIVNIVKSDFEDEINQFEDEINQEVKCRIMSIDRNSGDIQELDLDSDYLEDIIDILKTARPVKNLKRKRR